MNCCSSGGREGRTKNGHGSFADAFFSPVVVLWYLIFQRLSDDHSLETVVHDALDGGVKGLIKAVAKEKRNKKLARLKSRSTSAYNQARQALPAEVVQKACRFFSQEIARLWMEAQRSVASSGVAATEGIRPIGLIDGSTIAMRPFGDINKVFGGPTNQHRKAYWCLMRVAACFCLGSGAVMAAACGSYATSEVELCWQLMADTAAGCIFVADRGFGIYSVAERAVAFHHDVIVRLTDSRASRLRGKQSRKATELEVVWKPTSRDKLAPEAESRSITGRFLQVHLERKGYRSQILYLFTTLRDKDAYPLEQIVKWYGLRWNAELDFRYLKTVLDLKRLDVKSSQMAYKEFYAGILAYNLVRLFMQQASIQAKLSVMRLSFSSCLKIIKEALPTWIRRGVLLVSNRLQRLMKPLLRELAKCCLPRRKKPRPNEPRKVWPMNQTFPPMTHSRQLEREMLMQS